jgi:hypothetical protein
MQEHQSVLRHTDEFVKEAILDEEKLGVLVHELLAIEVPVQHAHCGPVSYDMQRQAERTTYSRRAH